MVAQVSRNGGSPEYENWWSMRTAEQEADERARRDDEQRFQCALSDATMPAREWCQKFLSGAALRPSASLDEKRGWLLAATAPALRVRSIPHPKPLDLEEGE